MANEFEIHGLEPVLKKLRGLAPKLQKKALRSAGTKAMKPVRDAARAGWRSVDNPETVANIAKRVVTQYSSKASKRVGGSVTKVGVLGGGKLTSDPENTGHWRFEELGTSQQPAHPIMRPALSERIPQVTDIFVSSLNSDIDKIIAKGL